MMLLLLGLLVIVMGIEANSYLILVGGMALVALGAARSLRKNRGSPRRITSPVNCVCCGAQNKRKYIRDSIE